MNDYGPGQQIDCIEKCDVPESVRLLQTSEEVMAFSMKCPNEGCPLYVRLVPGRN